MNSGKITPELDYDELLHKYNELKQKYEKLLQENHLLRNTTAQLLIGEVASLAYKELMSAKKKYGNERNVCGKLQMSPKDFEASKKLFDKYRQTRHRLAHQIFRKVTE